MFSSRIALGIGIATAAVALSVVAFFGWPFIGIILLFVLIPIGAVAAGMGHGGEKTPRTAPEWTGASDDPARRSAIRSHGGMISDRERTGAG